MRGSMQLIVFEENGSGQAKIRGIRIYGHGLTIGNVISIEGHLPELIDDPAAYIDSGFQADLVLNYLVHPDLSWYLIDLCHRKQIPVIAPGKQDHRALTPFTCCGLGEHKRLGAYGRQFGFPVYRVVLSGDGARISSIEVVRGAPCGATWDILDTVIGSTVDEALTRLPREVQYHCSANPAGFDPVTGRSPVHYAGHVHRKALEKAIQEAGA